MLNRGQVLLLTTLILGALISGAYLFVGYLSVKKLKQANNTVDSQQAIYASDTGIEAEFYRILKSKNPTNPICPFSDSNPNVGFWASSCVVDIGSGQYTLVIKSIGQAYKAVRSQRDFSHSISSSTKQNANLPLCSSNPLPTPCPSNLLNIY